MGLIGPRTAFLLLLAAQARSAIPPAPPNLRVEFVTRTEIALQWDSSTGATAYSADVRETQGSETWLPFGPGATFVTTSLRLGELTKNVAYDVRIYAMNSHGRSAPSTLSSIVPVDSPLPPTQVREAAHTKTTISLTWTPPASPAATHFRVLVSECKKSVGQDECATGRPCLSDRTVKCSDYALYKESGVVKEFSGTPALVKGLTNGLVYFFVVEARNLNIGGE